MTKREADAEFACECGTNLTPKMAKMNTNPLCRSSEGGGNNQSKKAVDLVIEEKETMSRKNSGGGNMEAEHSGTTKQTLPQIESGNRLFFPNEVLLNYSFKYQTCSKTMLR